jgi:hypothetical protein
VNFRFRYSGVITAKFLGCEKKSQAASSDMGMNWVFLREYTDIFEGVEELKRLKKG